MRALLVLNKNREKDVKVVVRLERKILIQQVKRLIGEARREEAFNLLLKKAQVEDFIFPGQEIKDAPELMLIEDVLK